ncbi:MAG: fibronectin type III domain-containing protein [Chitinispirillaceae bacterium]|jgi:hypothetical protein|nr:fibronectin type III domain-containing protein [Chitinispirillaceae bacterium]
MTKQLSCLLALIILSVCSCSRSSDSHTFPIIKSIDRYSACIVWTTDKPEKASLDYYSEGEKPKSVTENTADKVHEIKITGLLPDKVYYYRISRLSGQEFSFRTAPLSGSPFRFCLINTDKRLDKAGRFFPDFIVFVNQKIALELQAASEAQDLHARMPFFGGADSFAWGDLQFSSGEKTPPVSASKERTFVSIAAADAPSQPANDSLRRLIIVPGTGGAGGDSVSVIDFGNTTVLFCAGRSMVFETQGTDIRAGVMGSEDADALPYQLKKTTLSFTKTCVVCRRLLEKKQYKSSIDFYRRFIGENREQKLVDDALFQIANIYDRYLFDYPGAVAAYVRLISECPESGFSATARFRLDYIQKYRDYDFEPLKLFEQARMAEAPAERREAVLRIESLLARYKTFALRDEILLWLGNILADREPKRAVSYLSLLQSETQNPDYFSKASMKIGDINYDKRHYREALRHYQALAKKNNAVTAALDAKITRSIRNQNRQIIAFCCISILFSLVILALLLKPAGFVLPKVGACIWITAGSLAAAIIPVAIWYDDLITVIPFALTLSLSLPALFFLSWQFARKIRILILHIALALIAALCLLYILAYQFHYLFLFERLFS